MPWLTRVFLLVEHSGRLSLMEKRYLQINCGRQVTYAGNMQQVRLVSIFFLVML